MFQLNGKTALVTGATGGIGGAIARAFHAQGATVALSGRKIDALEALAKELGNVRVHIVPGDLSTVEGAQKVANDAIAAMERVDILVNNAGLTRDNLSMRMKEEEWQNVIDVNLSAAFRLSQAMMKPMMKARFGRIISIASIVGVTGNPGQCNYAASKGGLIAMSKSMAAEVASRGITVNCIAPGFIQTAMTHELNDSQKETLLKNIPSARLGVSEDIAAAAVFLASDEAAYITGQTIHVNGGMAMI